MKTYQEIAENDLLWAKASLPIGDKLGEYNVVVLQAEYSIQIAERIRDALYEEIGKINHIGLPNEEKEQVVFGKEI